MTQEALAAALNVSSQAISKWENNATMPDISLLPRIADAFDVTVDDLFGLPHKAAEIYPLGGGAAGLDIRPHSQQYVGRRYAAAKGVFCGVCEKTLADAPEQSFRLCVAECGGQSTPARIWLFPICRVQRIPCGCSKVRKPASFCSFWPTRRYVPC